MFGCTLVQQTQPQNPWKGSDGTLMWVGALAGPYDCQSWVRTCSSGYVLVACGCRACWCCLCLLEGCVGHCRGVMESMSPVRCTSRKLLLLLAHHECSLLAVKGYYVVASWSSGRVQDSGSGFWSSPGFNTLLVHQLVVPLCKALYAVDLSGCVVIMHSGLCKQYTK